MPNTPSTAQERDDAAARQPARSDAPATADTGGLSENGTAEAPPQGSPAAPVMKQFARTEAESGTGSK